MGCLPMYFGTEKRRTQDKFSAISKNSPIHAPSGGKPQRDTDNFGEKEGFVQGDLGLRGRRRVSRMGGPRQVREMAYWLEAENELDG